MLSQVVLLQNVPVNADPTSTDKRRKFALTEETKKLTKDIVDDKLELAVFFDAYDDGFLDILVVDSDGKIKAYINNLGIDATWIKAMVYTGFCGSLSGKQSRRFKSLFSAAKCMWGKELEV